MLPGTGRVFVMCVRARWWFLYTLVFLLLSLLLSCQIFLVCSCERKNDEIKERKNDRTKWNEQKNISCCTFRNIDTRVPMNEEEEESCQANLLHYSQIFSSQRAANFVSDLYVRLIRTLKSLHHLNSRLFKAPNKKESAAAVIINAKPVSRKNV